MAKVISIDCGGTNLRVAVVDENLNIICAKRGPTVQNDGYKLYEKMKSLILEVSATAKLTSIPSIGLSICGTVSHNAVGRCGNLGLPNGFDFESLFHKDFPDSKIKIANDGNCSALVEALYGVNKGLRDSAFVTISSGIGLGIVHNGEMIDSPMEGGRVIIEYQNNFYEAEYILSGNGIVRLCHMNGLEITGGSQFFDLIRGHDPKALKIYDIWLKELGMWFANIQLLFNCQQYALSGGVMKSQEIFLKDLERVSNAAIASWHLNPIVLKNAHFDQDVGIAAAGCLALHELDK
jgi:predicted NBD/HSP70 family sugar kinase